MTSFEPASENYRERTRAIFKKAPFIQDLGIELSDLAPGRVESRLDLQPKHMQQDGYVHAGVLATMADHTAGAAGGSLIPDGVIVLTVEYKVNLLKAAQGKALFCRAEVLKAGRMLTVVESKVSTYGDEGRKLVASATVTLASVPEPAS